VGGVAEKFRAFVFLDRKQAQGKLAPAELARWKARKRELSRELAGGADAGARHR